MRRPQSRLPLSSPGRAVAGVDEAGRGPLAGPVVAAAVILHPARRIAGLRDSKQLPASTRAQLAADIMRHAAACAIAWADPAEIDSLNILQASLLAMVRAVLRLPLPPERIQVDGNRAPDFMRAGLCCRCEPIVGGDATVPCISAASILAKTWRDRCMAQWEERLPGYGFARHKGYPTREHREALRALGPSLIHRRSFAPVRLALSAAGGGS